ncbi:MAG TPA: hemagglutinin protein, partial [Flavobacteriales bacterium]|nr:hemagglutinin protein [Flavobacteriales bacterium]
RDKATPSLVRASRSALVQRDGDIVDTDGVSPLVFTTPVEQYHVAVRHRNHLGAMTAQPVLLTREALPVDLSSSALVTWGTDARKAINGTMALWAGNSLVDGTLKYMGDGNDRDPILFRVGGSVPTNTAVGYDVSDVNMNGEVKYVGDGNDRDPILMNIGGSVPTVTRTQQLP